MKIKIYEILCVAMIGFLEIIYQIMKNNIHYKTVAKCGFLLMILGIGIYMLPKYRLIAGVILVGSLLLEIAALIKCLEKKDEN